MTRPIKGHQAADTPGLAPVRKVTAAGIGGAAAVVLVWVASLFGLDMSPEVGAALAALLAFGAGYVVPGPGTAG